MKELVQLHGVNADFPSPIINYSGIWRKVNDRLKMNDWGSIEIHELSSSGQNCGLQLSSHKK